MARGGEDQRRSPVAKRLVRACDRNCVDSSAPRSAPISWARSLGLSQQDPSWSLVGLQVAKWSQTIKHFGVETPHSHKRLQFCYFFKSLPAKHFSRLLINSRQKRTWPRFNLSPPVSRKDFSDPSLWGSCTFLCPLFLRHNTMFPRISF